jgi:hypothetical protein
MELKVVIYAALFLVAFHVLSPFSYALDMPSGIDNPMAVRFPELLTAPAPPWLQEGVRVTYDTLASDSGKTGNGLVQTDVVALEGGKVATVTQSYVPYLITGPMRPLTTGGAIETAGCGDIWCNPEILQKIPDRTEDDLTVLRVPITVGGKQYQAIRLSFKQGTYELADFYDLDTGILLYRTIDYTSSSRATHYMIELRNLRKVNIPWKDGMVPVWLSPGDTLSYQGQTMTKTQGAPTMSYQLSIRASVLSAQKKFAVINQITYSPDPISSSQIKTSQTKCISGVAQLLGYWIPQEAIATLSPGVIDTDPDTKMQISMIKGANRVVFEKTNQMDYKMQYAYDSSGKLVQTYYECNPTTVVLQLVG